MRHTKLIFSAVFATIFLSVLGLFSILPQSALAATNYAVHLQVSPTKQKISLEPGETYHSSFRVMNIGTDEFNYTTSVTPYSVVDNNYSPDYNTKGDYSQIADWITFDDDTASGTLSSEEEVTISFTIKVPEDVPAGGQYAAIMAQTEDGSTSESNVKAVNRVGMLLYANVSGDTRREGEIINNNINNFFFKPPISATSLVENTGNVDQVATYTMIVWPLFSGESIYSNVDNPTELDILPNTKRFNTQSWDQAPRLGIFKVEQTIEFAGKNSTVKKLVIVCPLWLLFLIFAIIFFIIFWLVSRAKARKQAAKDRSKR